MSNAKDIYAPPIAGLDSKGPPAPKPTNVGWIWGTLSLLVFLFNLLLVLPRANTGDIASMLGILVGSTIAPQAIVILGFSIGNRFRNNRSRIKIFFWTSLLFTVSNMSLLLGHLQ